MLIFGIIICAAIIVILVLITEKKGDPGEMESYYQLPKSAAGHAGSDKKTDSEQQQIRHIEPTRHTME